MRTTTTRSTLGLAALGAASVLLVACPLSPYVSATGTFATAATSESTAFTSDVSAASTLCLRRSTFDFIFNRIAGNPAAMQWSTWYSTKQIAPPAAETWKQHCETIASSDALALRGMQSLSAYAQALQGAVNGGSYDGGTAATAATDIGTLVGDVAPKASPVAAAVKSLGAPIAALGTIIIQNYTAGELKKSISCSNTPVNQILAALKAYDAAVADELRDAKDHLKEAMDAANAKLGATPSPDAVLVVSQVSEAYRTELWTIDTALTSHQKVLDDLQQAHDALYKAATASISDADALKLVQQYVNDVATILTGMKTAVTGGKDAGR